MQFDHQYLGQNLIFIVGCPRSGTTWLQRLLASHPKIKTGQESNLFSGYIGPQLHKFYADLNPEFRGGVGMGCYLTEGEFLDIMRSFMLMLLRPLLEPLETGDFFLEKTPDHSKYLQEIMTFLPQSFIIHMIRDARDVVASLLSASRSWGARWAPKTAQHAATTWNNYVTGIQQAQNRIPFQQFLEVRYEELHSNPQQVLRMCANFLGLEWSSSELERVIDHNNPQTISERNPGTLIPLGGEVAHRLKRTSVDEPKGFIRRAQPGNWHKDLNFLEKYEVWRLCRTMMAKFGYSWSHPWSLS